MNIVFDLVQPQFKILESLFEFLIVEAGQPPAPLVEVAEQVLYDVHVGDHSHERNDDRQIVGKGDAEYLQKGLLTQSLVNLPH